MRKTTVGTFITSVHSTPTSMCNPLLPSRQTKFSSPRPKPRWRSVMTPKLTISKVSLVLSGALFAFSLSAFAQDAIPQGTTLPVRLDSSISLNSKPGARITARVMQNVPLQNNERVREGSKLVGHVIAVNPPDANGRSQVSIRFEELIASGRAIPVSTSLTALAGFMAVEQAQIPATGPDRGTPST